MNWPKCYVCEKSTENRGCYEVKYLSKTYVLCGHHINKVVVFIEKMKEKD